MSDEEVIRSLKNNQCLVGPHCKKSGDCYGGGASHCDNYVRDRLISASDPEFEAPESSWEKLFTQPCEMYWEYFISSVGVPIISKNDGGRVTYYYVNGGETQEIPFNEERVHINGNIYTVIPPLKDSIYKVPMSCLSHKGERICAVTKTINSISEGEVFMLDKDYMSHSGGIFVHISCDQFPSEETKEDLYKKYYKELSSAASVESLVNIIVLVLYENMQSNYNSMLLKSRVSYKTKETS